MKKINSLLRKCKTLSRHLGRSSSYSSLRSKSTKGPDYNYQEFWGGNANLPEKEPCGTIFVGSSRRRYVISSKYLNHPLLNALIAKSGQEMGPGQDSGLSVKCEVVLFDHLLWMLENSDPNYLTSDSFEELAELYIY